MLDQQDLTILQLGGAVGAEQQTTQPACQLNQGVAAAMDCVQMIPSVGMILMAPCITADGTVEGSMLANGTEMDTQTWAGRQIKPAVPVEGGVRNSTLQVARVSTLSLKVTSTAAVVHTNRSPDPLPMVPTMQLTTSPSARI